MTVVKQPLPADLQGGTDFGDGAAPIYDLVLGQALSGGRVDPQALAQAATAAGGGQSGGGGLGNLAAGFGGGYSASVSSGAETGDQTQGDIDLGNKFGGFGSKFSAFNTGPSTGAIIGVAIAAVVGLLGLGWLLTRKGK